jgi:hypothetical protein
VVYRHQASPRDQRRIVASSHRRIVASPHCRKTNVHKRTDLKRSPAKRNEQIAPASKGQVAAVAKGQTAAAKGISQQQTRTPKGRIDGGIGEVGAAKIAGHAGQTSEKG